MTTFLVVGPAYGQTRPAKPDPLTKAKNAVAAAKKEANAAAGAFQEAYAALTRIGDQLSETQVQLDATSDSISSLQTKASSQAQDAYIRLSEEKINESYKDEVDETRRDQLRQTVTEFDDRQLTEFVGMKEDLSAKRDELAKLKQDRKDTMDELAKQKKTLDAKLAASKKAQKTLENKIARDKKAAAASAAAKSFKSTSAPGTIINAGSGSMTCPVQGSLAFHNDWGNSRSGGRTHKGTDLFAPRGTPNVAIVSGTVTFKNGGGLGGISAFVRSGNITYYYTHLNDTVGGPRSVKRGEVIGHTGSTGNAAGGATHTHFEIWKGSVKVNPYATLASIC